MLTPLETGEKLGIYHLTKILRSCYCDFDSTTESYKLQPPLQGQLGRYMVSQVSSRGEISLEGSLINSLRQAVVRALSIWPWDLNSPRDTETSAWLRDEISSMIELGDLEENTVRQGQNLSCQ